jgi:hypothetical protein
MRLKQLSYKGRQKGSYGSQHRGKSGFHGFGKGKSRNDTLKAERSFENRSKRSKSQDLVRLADIAPSLTVYLKNPNRYDWPSIDTPDAALIFSHKSKMSQAVDLAKAAKKKPVEIWIKDTSQSDIKGVDSPGSKGSKHEKAEPKTHRFRILKKSTAEKELKKKQKELAEADVVNFNIPLVEKGHMPTEKEILEKAQEMYQKENFKAIHEESMPEQMPTKSELSEEGYLQSAKLDLMTKSDTKNERQIFDYVEGLRSELNKIGFEVIPMEGFSVEDLKF